jgi:hypothetical protein
MYFRGAFAVEAALHMLFDRMVVGQFLPSTSAMALCT